MTLPVLLAGLLGYVLYPLWLLAGVADYACHRATRIADTSGPVESALHLLQLALLGLPILLFLFLEPTALVLTILALCVLAHGVAGFIDIAYTTGRRAIPPLEQHVHSWLEMLPLGALAIVVLLEWPQAAAIFAGQGDWTFRSRQPPLPASTLLLVIGTALLFAVLPGLLEFRSTLRGRRVGRAGIQR